MPKTRTTEISKLKDAENEVINKLPTKKTKNVDKEMAEKKVKMTVKKATDKTILAGISAKAASDTVETLHEAMDENSGGLSEIKKSRGRVPRKNKTHISKDQVDKINSASIIQSSNSQPQDIEARRMRLKILIGLGKERGYLTYAEINDHLPDDMLDAEQIEGIISMINDMGISVHDEAPDVETLLMSDAATTVADEDVAEEAEAALSTVDSEFGRTTDPVRMYMREMGSVGLLTRESEIEIAKRIEGGLRHMIQAISACPPIIAKIVDLAVEVEKETMRIDEVVDGLLDANAQDIINEELSEEAIEQELSSNDLAGDEDEDEDSDFSAVISFEFSFSSENQFLFSLLI